MTETVEEIGGTITREGKDAVIRLPIAQVHRLRVALNPCGCIANKTNATVAVRSALKRALGAVIAAT